MGQDTKWKLFQRNGNWSAREVGGKRRRVSLGTKDKEVALAKMASELGEMVLPKESQKHYALAKAHLKLVDPKMGERTWGDLAHAWTYKPGIGPSTIARREREFGSGFWLNIKDVNLTCSSVKSLIPQPIGIWHREVLRSLQNYAMDLGWMVARTIPPVMLKLHKSERRKVRAITREEHEAICAAEEASIERRVPNAMHGIERSHYYQMLWHIGAAQMDGAMLTHEHIDRDGPVPCLRYNRAKTGEARAMAIGKELGELIDKLPKEGFLFPNMAQMKTNKRAHFFRRMRGRVMRSPSTPTATHGPSGL